MELLGQIHDLRGALSKCIDRIIKDGERLDRIQTDIDPGTNASDAEKFISKLMLNEVH
jgi:hypothetical protein